MKGIALLGLLVLFGPFAFSQITPADSAGTDQPDAYGKGSVIMSRGKSSTGLAEIAKDDFNTGNIHDPLELIQAKVSGLLIAKPGNDPNGPYSARLRGVHSVYLSNSPLLVVDGMPFSSLLNVDPNDIESITVVKDASVASQFGLNSMNGAILIETGVPRNNKLSVRTYAALESPVDQTDLVLDRDAYLNAGGGDVGGDTDWLDEVTRNALTSVINISYGNQSKGTGYFGSFNYRHAEGILEGSGFQSLNTRAGLTQILFHDRLKFSANLSMTHRINNFSFPEAFKYAMTYAPSSPVYYPNGEYIEYLIFDSYNPVAILHQNTHDGNTDIGRVGTNLELKLTNSLTLRGGFQYEYQDNSVRKYWSKASPWNGTFRNGYRTQEEQNLSTNRGLVQAEYNRRFARTTLGLSGTFSAQNLDFEEGDTEGYNFETDAIGAGDVSDFENRAGVGWRSATYSKNHGITTYGIAASLNTSDRLFINANLWHELFSDHLNGTTYGLGTAYDFSGSRTSAFSELKPGISVGRTEGAMSFFQNYNPGNIMSSWRYVPAKGIKPEHKDEVNLGVDWALKKLSGSMNVFRSTAYDVIVQKWISNGDGTFSSPFVNDARIRNAGLELDVNWFVMKTERIKWRTSLNLSFIRNTFMADTVYSFQPIEFIPNHGSSDVFANQDGRPVGQLWGQDYEGVSGGQQQFRDVDGDGTLSYSDFQAFGRPLPGSFVGWTTDLTMGKWHVSVTFRGSLGHTLINALRLSYENPILVSTYNLPGTIYDVEGVDVQAWTSDLYLEDASYATLDNLSASYRLFTRASHGFGCSLDMAIQNLFMLTNYQGATPEVRLDHNGAQYAAGFDSLYTYQPSRTFLLGVHFEF